MSSTIPASGPWTGFFNHQAGGQRHRMDLSLTFLDGIISGQGYDKLGMFGIGGCYDMGQGEILLTKTYYLGARVRCRGFVDGLTIWGTWENKESLKGGFHMWPWGQMVENELAEGAVKSALPLSIPKLRSQSSNE